MSDTQGTSSEPFADTSWRGQSGSAPIFDEITAQPETVPIAVFMANHSLDRAALRELLREYRSEAGWGAYEFGQRDELSADFLNWFYWEWLG